MSNLSEASVPVRQEVITTEEQQFADLAAPGAVLSGEDRVSLAKASRSGQMDGALQEFARHLYAHPGSVHAEHVRAAADMAGDPAVVEAIGIVSRLRAIDRVHEVVGVDLEPLPTPSSDVPTGNITPGLNRGRGHLPMPPGPIPMTLDLVPSEGDALRAMFGALYMTDHEMGDPHFHREPGLNTPQLETIAARISLLNECFY